MSYCPSISHVAGNVDVTDTTGSPNSFVAVDLNLNVTGVADGSVTVSWDGSVFDWVQLTPGTDDDNFVPAALAGDAGLITSCSHSGASATCSWASTHDNTSAGVRGRLWLHLPSGAPDPTRTELTLSGSFSDSTPTTLPLSLGNGVVQVGDCSPPMPAFGPLWIVGFENAQKLLTAFLDVSGRVRFSRSRDDGDTFTVDASEG